MFDEVLKYIYEQNQELVKQSKMETDENSTNVIVTNVPKQLFTNEEVKQAFRVLFKPYSPENFVFLPSFKRVRVSFSSPKDSQNAIKELQDYCFHSTQLKLLSLKTISFGRSNQSLRPPTPEKQFLISPPASPPVGWEQVREDKPVVNLDLLVAVAEMKPGTRHELQPATVSTPQVVVDICEESPFVGRGHGLKIPHTKRPNSN